MGDASKAFHILIYAQQKECVDLFRYNDDTNFNHKEAYRNNMNKRMVEGINKNMDEIIEQLASAYERGKRRDVSSTLCLRQLVEKTSREFAELMTSNIAEKRYRQLRKAK